MDLILQYFHHIHHESDKHEVHHCGGNHKGINYKIEHCSCGKHRINKVEAVGHDFKGRDVKIGFSEECIDGGWHIESGQVVIVE